MAEQMNTPEERRLEEDGRRQRNWKRWGPYLPERQWGTVREDYSADGTCWDYLPHDHARRRACLWAGAGLLGFAARDCRFCSVVASSKGARPTLEAGRLA